MTIMKKMIKERNSLDKMAITITESAAKRVKTFLDDRGKGIGLRVELKQQAALEWHM